MKKMVMNRRAPARQPRRVLISQHGESIRVNVFVGDECVDSTLLSGNDAGIEDAILLVRAALRRR